MQEIRKRNNIQYLEKWEIFFSFAYVSAFWLLFGQNPIEFIVGKIFVLDFAKIVTANSWLISKTEEYFSFLQILNIVSFSNFLHSWWGQITNKQFSIFRCLALATYLHNDTSNNIEEKKIAFPRKGTRILAKCNS